MTTELTYEDLLKKNKKLEREASLRIEAMVALDNRLEMYSALVDNASDLIHSVTPEGSFIYVNKAWRDTLGYNLEDLSQIKLMDIVDESSRRKCQDIFNCLIQGQSIERSETTFLSKDGKRILVEGSCNTKFEGDNPVAIVGIFRDISKRTQSELALRESEEKYRTLFENSTDLIQAVRPDGRLLYVNNAWKKTFGYHQQDIDNGLSIFNLISPDCQDHCEATFHKVISSEDVHFINTKFVSKDGSQVIIEGNACCRFKDGKPFETQCIFRDVTEKKRMEEELRQAQKMESIGTLAGGIAHDFNNILSAVLGYTQLAMLSIDNPDNIRNNLDEVLKGANRAKELVQQILTFSRKKEQELNPVKVQLIIKEALNLLRSSLPATIEIKQNINPDCNTVLADPTQIHQVTMNLCTNAYYSMRENGGVLRVSLQPVILNKEDSGDVLKLKHGEYVKLEVSDTGVGIPEETVSKIFDPYFTTKAKGEGTGLGLAVVHGIVKSHNGDIKVTSQPGQGTTFHVYFPTVDKKPIGFSSKNEKEVLIGGDESIMVVDDEASIANLSEEILTQYGYKVYSYRNVVQALQDFEKNPEDYDLVITDMTMPYMTGVELAQKMMKTNPKIPVILCTGHSELINREKALDIGIKDFFIKPIGVDDLLKRTRQVLDNRG
jgi:PAS domain S-box-containing protein